MGLSLLSLSEDGVEEVTRDLEEYSQNVEEANKLRFLSYFDMGVKANGLYDTYRMTKAEAAAKIGVNVFQLSLYIRVADYFKGDRKWFTDFITHKKYTSFEKIVEDTIGYKKDYKIMTKSQRRVISDSIKRAIIGDEPAFEQIKGLYGSLRRIVPQTNIIKDLDYFKYADCNCCGKEATDEGHNLYIHKQYVKIPLCKGCFSQAKDEPEGIIDWESIACLYATYALECEREYEEMRGAFVE